MTDELKPYGMKAASDVTLADEGKVTAVVARLGIVDNDGEVILGDAFPTGESKATVSLYSHDTVMGSMLGTGRVDAPPVGKGIISVEGNQAVFRGQYFMETARGKEAFLTVKAMGTDQAWSFAYLQDTAPPTAEWQAKGAKRMLTKVTPLLDGAFEVSPVKNPGGKGTGTVAVKHADPPTPEPKAETDVALEERIARVKRQIGR